MKYQKYEACLFRTNIFDHAGYINQYLDAGINVYVGSLVGYKFKSKRLPLLFEQEHVFEIGEFRIIPFAVKHDVPCFGFLIRHKETGLVLFVTDTQYIPFKFPDLNNILIEANYSESILDENISSGSLPMIVRNRVINSHMSLNTCKEVLKANDLSGVNNIVLMHLSSGNSDPELFVKEIKDLTGKQVYVAKRGMEIPFNSLPF